jgi:hypothetical protein
MLRILIKILKYVFFFCNNLFGTRLNYGKRALLTNYNQKVGNLLSSPWNCFRRRNHGHLKVFLDTGGLSNLTNCKTFFFHIKKSTNFNKMKKTKFEMLISEGKVTFYDSGGKLSFKVSVFMPLKSDNHCS